MHVRNRYFESSSAVDFHLIFEAMYTYIGRWESKETSEYQALHNLFGSMPLRIAVAHASSVRVILSFPTSNTLETTKHFGFKRLFV